MTTRIGQHIQVTKRAPDPKRKTKIWDLSSLTGNDLGTIRWFGRWHQYVFEPLPGTVFNAGCLDDVHKFLGKENRAWRAERAQRKS